MALFWIKMNKSKLIHDLINDREHKVSAIRELTSDKIGIEQDIVEILIEDRATHCFTVNWNRVIRTYR